MAQPNMVHFPPKARTEDIWQTSAAAARVRVADASTSRYTSQSCHDLFEEGDLCCGDSVEGDLGTSSFEGMIWKDRQSGGGAPSNHSNPLSTEASRKPCGWTIGYGVDDLFESVPIAVSNLDKEHTTNNSKSQWIPGLPNSSASAPHSAGHSPFGVPWDVTDLYGDYTFEFPMDNDEELMHTRESMSTTSLCGAQEEQELTKKRRKQRFNKGQRDRYRRLVESLVEHAVGDPMNFDLSRHKLPPRIASSEVLQAKLLETVRKFAQLAQSNAGC